MSIYNFLYACLAWIFRGVYRVHTHGEENVPMDGGAVFAPNHTSAMDCVIVAVSAPRRAYYMAKAELFKIPILSSLFRALGAFPVKRQASDVGAIKKSIELIKENKALCIFPQGTRCPGASLIETKDKLKSGVGLIAHRAEVPIVPVYIKTKKNRVKLFCRTDVYYGEPVSVDTYTALIGKNRYDDTTALVFDRICDMEKQHNA